MKPQDRYNQNNSVGIAAYVAWRLVLLHRLFRPNLRSLGFEHGDDGEPLPGQDDPRQVRTSKGGGEGRIVGSAMATRR